ncbi:MAG: SDR family oxidoreductase [Myxococcota bacterium]
MAQRAVVITGASTGIGEACAVWLAERGWRVFAGVRKAQDGEAVAAKAKGITPVIIDVTREETIRDAAAQVADALGGEGLAGLVNNAGIVVALPLEYVRLDLLRMQFEVNVVGQIAVTQAFMPLLRKAKGRVVMMGSSSGRAATPLMGPYSASKFALEALTDSLRMELMPWGIQVSIVEPGAIATPIWDKSTAANEGYEREMPEEGRQRYQPLIDAMRAMVNGVTKRASPASAVALAVEDALGADEPRTRYLVGTDAKVQATLAKVLPDRVRDKLLAKVMKLPAYSGSSGR